MFPSSSVVWNCIVLCISLPFRPRRYNKCLTFCAADFLSMLMSIYKQTSSFHFFQVWEKLLASKSIVSGGWSTFSFVVEFWRVFTQTKENITFSLIVANNHLTFCYLFMLTFLASSPKLLIQYDFNQYLKLKLMVFYHILVSNISRFARWPSYIWKVIIFFSHVC